MGEHKPVFKRAGKKLQVVSYRGYDKKTKNSKLVMIGSIADGIFTPRKEEEANITEAERFYIARKIADMKSQAESAAKYQAFFGAAATLAQIAEAMEKTEITEAWAAEVLPLLAKIQSGLRKKGYTKRDYVFKKEEAKGGE